RADETIVSRVRRCHDALQPTRGAVMGLASFGAWENGMQWLGIGNVEGVVLRAHAAARPRVERLLARGGVVGHRLPRLLVSTVALTRDDVVVLATDGIHTDFADRLTVGEPPRALADRILAAYGKESDDALVLVARYMGGPPWRQRTASGRSRWLGRSSARACRRSPWPSVASGTPSPACATSINCCASPTRRPTSSSLSSSHPPSIPSSARIWTAPLYCGT